MKRNVEYVAVQVMGAPASIAMKQSNRNPAAPGIAEDRYLKRDLPGVVGLSLEVIADLILIGTFPGATCHPLIGASWARGEVDAVAQELWHRSAVTPDSPLSGDRS